jgi:hypothetical protein
MSVKLAVQVFSHSVASLISTAADLKQIPQATAFNTADFLELVNNIFDALNSRVNKASNPYNCGLSKKNLIARKCLEEACDWIDTWTVDRKSNRVLEKPYCFTGLQMTIRSILDLWEDLESEGYWYLLTNRLNQDPLENLFSNIRARGGFDPNPTAQRFRRNLQHVIVMQLMKPPASSNCEADDDELLSVDAIVSIPESTEPPVDLASEEAVDDVVATDNSLWELDSDEEEALHAALELVELQLDGEGYEIPDTPIDTFTTITTPSPVTLEVCAARYFAGYVAYVCQNRFSCESCKADMIKPNQQMERREELFMFYKAFQNRARDELGSLCAPTEEMVIVAKLQLEIFVQHFPRIRHTKGVKRKLVERMVAAVREILPNWLSGDCLKHKQFALEHLATVKLKKELLWMSHSIRRPKSASNPLVTDKRSKTSTTSTQSTQKPNRKLRNLKNN